MKNAMKIFDIRVSSIKEEEWKTVIDFTKFRKGGMPVDEVIKALKAIA